MTSALRAAVASCVRGRALLLALAAAAAAPCGPAAAGEVALWPYKDVTLGIDAAVPRIVLPAWAERDRGPLIWAFATGECGEERWGPFDTDAFARLNVGEWSAAGRPYIVATGGEAGIFTCGSSNKEGLARFVARYDSPAWRGVDFDIEGRQTSAQIRDLVAMARYLHALRPRLRLSFTLATHAGSDGSARSLNATGAAVLRSLREARLLEHAVINLMVMNYGPADARWCVPARAASTATAPARAASSPAAPAPSASLPVSSPARCDMGASAEQAVRNVSRRFGIALRRIAATAMLGENDVEGNRFDEADARRLRRRAQQLGLEALHYWSLDRDQACPPQSPRVSSTCHALPGLAPGRLHELLKGSP